MAATIEELASLGIEPTFSLDHSLKAQALAAGVECIAGCIEGRDCTWCRCGGHEGPLRWKAGAEEAS